MTTSGINPPYLPGSDDKLRAALDSVLCNRLARTVELVDATLEVVDAVVGPKIAEHLRRAEVATNRATRAASTCGGCKDPLFRHNLACDVIRALNGEDIDPR